MPLQVARRCQDLGQVSDRALHVANALYDAGVHGQAIDEALERATRLTDRLRGSPDWCFQQPDGAIVGQSTKESTIQTWQTLLLQYSSWIL